MENTFNFRVSIEPDELAAYLTIDPSIEKIELNVAKLKNILKGNRVLYGYRENMLESVVNDYLKGNLVEHVLVADGVKAISGKQAQIDFKFEFTFRPKETEEGKIDYREIGRIINVKKDQLLAIKKKLIPAITGVTVTGKLTELPEVRDVPLTAGKNVRKSMGREENGQIIEDENVYFYAEAEGALKFENNTLAVHPSLTIDQDVDFNIGNIRFNGDVKIGRDILSGFLVSAEGKIYIWGSAIACTVIGTDDIEIKGGVMGKNKGEIKSDGSILTTFVENAKVSARNDILVKNGVIGSEITCGGTLKFNLRGARLVGSYVKAGKGIQAFTVGSRFDTTTRLITGIDFEKEAEYTQVKDVMEIKIEEMKKIEKRYGKNSLERNTPPQVGNVKQGAIDFEKWHLLRDELTEIQEMLKKAEDLMYDYSATVIIREVLFPNVFVQIGKYKFTSTREYKNITIKYSKEEGRLIY